MFKKFIALFSSMTTLRVLQLFMAIMLALMVMAVVAVSFSPYLGLFLFILGFVDFGFLGLFIIIRKEFPWIIPIKGWLAVVEGVVILVTSLVAAIGLTWGVLGGR